jgi:hypothetical protein
MWKLGLRPRYSWEYLFRNFGILSFQCGTLYIYVLCGFIQEFLLVRFIFFGFLLIPCSTYMYIGGLSSNSTSTTYVPPSPNSSLPCPSFESSPAQLHPFRPSFIYVCILHASPLLSRPCFPLSSDFPLRHIPRTLIPPCTFTFLSSSSRICLSRGQEKSQRLEGRTLSASGGEEGWDHGRHDLYCDISFKDFALLTDLAGAAQLWATLTPAAEKKVIAFVLPSSLKLCMTCMTSTPRVSMRSLRSYL